MTVYLDRVFLINVSIDYLLLLSAAEISSVTVKRLRFLLIAVFGGLYSTMTYLPGLMFLSAIPGKILAGFLMGLVAYKGKWKPALLFLLLSAALAGCLYCVDRDWPGNFKGMTLILSATVFAVFITILFFSGMRQRREILSAELFFSGRKWRITALHDTGNSLRDPQGRPVLIVSAEALNGLIPDLPPQELFSDLCCKYPEASCLLLPYRTIAGQGILPAIRLTRIRINHTLYENHYIAITDHHFPQNVQALWGGEVESEVDKHGYFLFAKAFKNVFH